MKPAEAAKLAKINYETARKWKAVYKKDPEHNIPFKKTDITSICYKSKLNESHKERITSFFDENPSAFIQDAVEDLTRSFKGLEIKKSRVGEFMKEECNLGIKVVTRLPQASNSKTTLETHAK
ncbi:hypothetical protein BD408DRAFT_426540 [Parasitella parasitica]|nr:hypothetical protein BD408DRAFT_426540 [Parasitella parasitica]